MTYSFLSSNSKQKKVNVHLYQLSAAVLLDGTFFSHLRMWQQHRINVKPIKIVEGFISKKLDRKIFENRLF